MVCEVLAQRIALFGVSNISKHTHICLFIYQMNSEKKKNQNQLIYIIIFFLAHSYVLTKKNQLLITCQVTDYWNILEEI